MKAWDVRGLVAWVLVPLAACTGDGDEAAGETCDQGQPQPAVMVASSAAGAWPGRATPSGPVTRAEVMTACVRWAECHDEPGGTAPDRILQDCVQWTLWSLERAVPLTFLVATEPSVPQADESAEAFVRCAATATCDTVASCLHPRTGQVTCQETGCVGGGTRAFTTTCQGDVATLTFGCAAPVTRDCARAGTTCDATSPTGCHDRPLTACDATQSRADRCDGDVRLGCDGSDHVSYRDCGRLEGGSCQTGAGGSDCVFGIGAATACGDDPRAVQAPACTPAGTFRMCVYGAVTEVTTSLCAPTATP